MSSNNLAARAGRWSARHWKTATFGWLAFVVIAAVVGGFVGTQELGDAGELDGDSARAEQIIQSAGFANVAAEAVLIQHRVRTPRTPAFRRAVEDTISALRTTAGVQKVFSPYDDVDAERISNDGHSVLIEVRLDTETGADYDGVAGTLATVAAAQRAHSGFRIEETGGASLERALDGTEDRDFRRAELSSIPLTIVILLAAFGALLAALLPVLLALTAFVAATGVLALASQVFPVESEAAGSVMLLIGLAVGVDYSLFYLKREREERALGKDRQSALEVAAATSGRSVLISGLTVIVAMAGMFLAGNRAIVGVGLGAIVVVAIAMLGSLTVLPALLSRLGDKVEFGRIPGLGRVRTGGESRIWSALLDRVLRRPLVSAVAAGGLLLALAAPAVGLHTARPGAGDLPQNLPPVRTLERIEAAFPGTPDPAAVVVRASDVTAPQVVSAFGRFEEQALASQAAHGPIEVDTNPAETVAVVSVPLAGKGAGDATSERALETIRRIARETLEPSGAEVAVGGEIAASRDFNATLKSHTPLVFAFVLVLAFVLLLVSFRSLVIATTTIVLNLLSIGAAYGLLVMIFQYGWGEKVLGFESTGSIVAWLPLFLFVVLFGLSMDYHVFILSRVREAYDRGLRTDEAIARGIKSTAGVITAAATVMVFVFGIFATLSQLSMKQLGVGLAAAILIDATLIRGVLLPATMKLLGEANWYLPRRLAWLPTLAHEPADRGELLRPSLDSTS